jgi:hypothetical protein
MILKRASWKNIKKKSQSFGSSCWTFKIHKNLILATNYGANQPNENFKLHNYWTHM